MELTGHERDRILKHTLAGNNQTDRLRIVSRIGQRPFYRAAEANHAKVKRPEKELRQLYSRMADHFRGFAGRTNQMRHRGYARWIVWFLIVMIGFCWILSAIETAPTFLLSKPPRRLRTRDGEMPLTRLHSIPGAAYCVRCQQLFGAARKIPDLISRRPPD